MKILKKKKKKKNPGGGGGGVRVDVNAELKFLKKNEWGGRGLQSG